MMFEDLDDAAFEGVAATYGMATTAPDRLRALGDPDPRTAREALYWIEADYFHQDLFCEATPLVVPYLLEVVATSSAVQRDVTSLLGRLLRGGADGRSDLAVYLSPDDPRYRDNDDLAEPDAIWARTRRAIELGRPVLTALVGAEDPEVRLIAGWAVAAFGPAVRADIEALLAREPDARVRACAWLALAALSPTNAVDPTLRTVRSDEAFEGVSEADLAHLVCATTLDGEVTEVAVRLLDTYKASWLPFADGRTEDIVVHHLRRLEPSEAALVAFLQRAIEVCDTHGAIALFARGVLFPSGVPRHAHELGEGQRWIFRNLWVGEARGVRLRFDDLAGQRAFVDGDGPLDVRVTADGRTGTVAELLLAQPGDAEALLGELARVWPEARVFDLAIAITRGDLGERVFEQAVLRTCLGSVTLERTLGYLATQPDLGLPELSLLLGPYLDPPREPPEVLDDLARQWSGQLSRGLRDWLRTFSPARLVPLVARAPNRAALSPLCDRLALGKEVVARGAKSLLAVPSSMLRERAGASADGDERARFEAELAERAARDQLLLSARKICEMELELMLPNGTRLLTLELERLRTGADLALLFDVIRDYPNAALKVHDSVPAWICEALANRARGPE